MQILLILLIAWGCAHKRDHGHANHHMHKKSHDELIKNFDDPARDEWQRPLWVLSQLGPLKDQRLIDIGVGSGYFTKFFLSADARVTGADVDEKFLRHVGERFPVKKFPHFETLKMDFDDPKMGRESFDLAFTSNTYHHIENRIPYLKKIRLGLKPRGRLVIIDFKSTKVGASKIGPPEEMRLSSTKVIEELEAAGFSRITVDETGLPNQYLIVAHKHPSS